MSKAAKRTLAVVLALLAVLAAVWLLNGGVERSARERIETVLIDNGLAPPLAACMAERLSSRLSVGQLRELERLAAELKAQGSGLTVAALLQSLRQVEDPALVEVTASSAAICAFGG